MFIMTAFSFKPPAPVTDLVRGFKLKRVDLD